MGSDEVKSGSLGRITLCALLVLGVATIARGQDEQTQAPPPEPALSSPASLPSLLSLPEPAQSSLSSSSTASPASQTSPPPSPPSSSRASSSNVVATAGKVLAGAALGLAVHESGHLTFDLLLGTKPGIKKVSYAGIPFFAITHDPVSARKEFLISSAGFWAQHLSNEVFLSRQPPLRDRSAPVMKGMFAFNILLSTIYAGAAIGRTGPLERDTRGIAMSARMAEPWVAPLLLAPAILDVARYAQPESPTLKWASRAAKVSGVLLIVRTR